MYENKKISKSISKVVLAYSGGLDTSAIIPWLKENYQCDVIACVADIGQGNEELDGIKEKAKNSGASSCHIIDLKSDFVENYIWPSIKTGAMYENGYLLGTALARPVTAKAQIELARRVNADAVAHGCTGKGNDQVRFEAAYAALAPDLQVIAPWREWNMKSRKDLIHYLHKKNIPSNASVEKIYSRDANAWHISHEGGELEDPWHAPSPHVWTWTCAPEHAPNEPEDIIIQFKQGIPMSINHQTYDAYTFLEKINKIAAQHSIGRLDIVENRLIGMKSRGCYETPGGTVIMAALRALETLVLDRDTLSLRHQFAECFGYMLYDGKWFTTAAQIIRSSAHQIAAEINGDVRVRLYKGQVTILGRRSPNSLYQEAFATFGHDDVYQQQDATGFIHLHTLSSKIKALLHQKTTSADPSDENRGAH